MADEVQQESPSTETTQEQPSQGEASEHQQPDPLEPSTEGSEGEGTEKPHPLDPEGDRFKQVWARGKQAEREKAELAAKLQEEREARIRLEEREKAREEAAKEKQANEKVYSWKELEGFIAEGKLTMADAMEYRENIIRKEAETKVQKTLENHLKLNTREDKVGKGIEAYRTLKPEMLQEGTPERERLKGEYKYLVEELGYPQNHATELAAARAAFGDLKALQNQAALKAKPVEREGHQETMTNQRPPVKAKDPIAGLNEAQKKHYTRMIEAGRYGSYSPRTGITAQHWAKVTEELTWKRKER